MRARGIVLALCALSAAPCARSQSPDWFDAFRGRAYLQGDASYLARDPAEPPDAPPLFRLRWVVLRFAGFTEAERRFWPYRNLLLVTMPTGARYVLESSFGFVDERHLDEERPFDRVASEKAAFEVWSSGTAGEAPVDSAAGDEPCAGNRQRVRAAGGSLTFYFGDLGSATVRTTLAEISAATFGEDERRDLASVMRIARARTPALSSELPNLPLYESLLGVSMTVRDRLPPPDRRTVLLVPDPSPPGDLAPWRGLAHLPLDFPPFPAPPPENPIQ